MTLYALLGSFEQGLIFSLAALGVLFTFRFLNFPDLTVDGSLPLGACISAALSVSGYSPWVSILVAFFGGSIAGLVTAFISIKFKVLHLLASIITMTALYSINLRIMGRPNLSLIGVESIFDQIGRYINLSSYNYIFTVLLIVTIVFIISIWFLKTEIGLALRTSGDNEDMAKSFGISTVRMTYLGLALSNGMVAVSGAILTQYQGSADISLGVGTIIVGLASVIIGEAILKSNSIAVKCLSVIVGSIIYRLVVGFALSMNSDGLTFLKPSDLNLITALMVALFLGIPNLKGAKAQ